MPEEGRAGRGRPHVGIEAGAGTRGAAPHGPESNARSVRGRNAGMLSFVMNSSCTSIFAMIVPSTLSRVRFYSRLLLRPRLVAFPGLERWLAHYTSPPPPAFWAADIHPLGAAAHLTAGIIYLPDAYLLCSID